MTAITSSKLYKASTRKSAILAALKNPINVQLVEQLKEYIGDDYQALTDPPVGSNGTTPTAPTAEQTSSTEPSVEPSKPSPPPAGTTPSLARKFAQTEKLLEGEEPTTEPTAEPAQTETPKAEASTATTGNPITAAAESNVSNLLTENQTQVKNLSTVVKETLNIREATNGVKRCAVKGNNEFWVYYNDSINLNNVMDDVISALNASEYGFLEFNRLARTDNAIVFVINTNDTDNQIKPVADATASGSEE